MNPLFETGNSVPRIKHEAGDESQALAINRAATVAPLRSNHSHVNVSPSATDTASEDDAPGRIPEEKWGDDDLMLLPPKQANQARFPPGCIVQVSETNEIGKVENIGIDFTSKDRTNLYKVVMKDNNDVVHCWTTEEELQFAPDCPVYVSLTLTLETYASDPARVLCGLPHHSNTEEKLPDTTLYSLMTVNGSSPLKVYHGIDVSHVRFRGNDTFNQSNENSNIVIHNTIKIKKEGAAAHIEQSIRNMVVQEFLPLPTNLMNKARYPNGCSILHFDSVSRRVTIGKVIQAGIDLGSKERGNCYKIQLQQHDNSDCQNNIVREETLLLAPRTKVWLTLPGNDSGKLHGTIVEIQHEFDLQLDNLRYSVQVLHQTSNASVTNKAIYAEVLPEQLEWYDGSLLATQRQPTIQNIKLDSGKTNHSGADASTSELATIPPCTNTQPNRFDFIVRGNRHRFPTAVKVLYDTKGHLSNLLESCCLPYHLRGKCNQGSDCIRAASHKPLSRNEAKIIEKELRPATSPDGPIYSSVTLLKKKSSSTTIEVRNCRRDREKSGKTRHDSNPDIPAGAVENCQPNQFQNITRGNKHRFTKAVLILSGTGGRRFGPAMTRCCLMYHLQGYCRQGAECPRSKSHRDLTRQEAQEMELELQPVTSPSGPIVCRPSNTSDRRSTGKRRAPVDDGTLSKRSKKRSKP